jgi:hypothetical protein
MVAQDKGPAANINRVVGQATPPMRLAAHVGHDLWTRYRQAVTYAFVSPLTTAGLGGMQAENIALEGLKRAVAALNDLETVAAIKKAL